MKDDHPDYPAVLAGNFILGGGGLSSRLADRLRQKGGLSYTAMSMFQASPLDARADLLILAIYNPKNRDKVVTGVDEELERLVRDGVTAAELDRAKTGYLQQQSVLRTNDTMLATLLANDLLHRPDHASSRPTWSRRSRHSRPKSSTPPSGNTLIPSGSRQSPRVISTRNDFMASLKGHLLIASTGLVDPNFARTVVLIAAHGEEGALGLILNREMSMPLQQIWGQVSQSECVRGGNVRHGGPVGGTLMAVHDVRPHANLIVTDDVYIATELHDMESLAGSDEGQAIFYIGHSGWGPGQLENELAEGSWLVLPCEPQHVFGDSDLNALWKEAMTEAGRRQVQSVIPIKHVPDDPSLN